MKVSAFLPPLLLVISMALANVARADKMHGFAFKLPVVSLSQDVGGGVELNLQQKAAVALEGSMVTEQEKLTESEQEDFENDSLITDGWQARIMFSRYTQPARLAGFFYGIGAGYRSVNVNWKRSQTELDSGAEDEIPISEHQGTMEGWTGIGRLGYRYVGQDFPMFVEFGVGIRHFQSEYKDKKDEEQGKEPTPSAAQESLKRRFMTGLDSAGLSIGYAF